MTKSSGFTLIELLVVVAIVGILSAVGIVSYNGYVDSTKKKATENILGTPTGSCPSCKLVPQLADFQVLTHCMYHTIS